MRISLCFRHSGQVHRLVWVNESQNGLYLGFLGAKKDAHASYHTDGVRHTKMGDEYLLPWQDVPISEWRGVRQLQHASLSLTKDWLSPRTAYEGDEKTETLVLLDETQFTNTTKCGLDLWLLDRLSEAELFRIIGTHVASDPKYRMLVEVVVALDHFPDHKIGLTLRAGPDSSNDA